jgi:hypothetical protein
VPSGKVALLVVAHESRFATVGPANDSDSAVGLVEADPSPPWSVENLTYEPANHECVSDSDERAVFTARAAERVDSSREHSCSLVGLIRRNSAEPLVVATRHNCPVVGDWCAVFEPLAVPNVDVCERLGDEVCRLDRASTRTVEYGLCASRSESIAGLPSLRPPDRAQHGVADIIPIHLAVAHEIESRTWHDSSLLHQPAVTRHRACEYRAPTAR